MTGSELFFAIIFYGVFTLFGAIGFPIVSRFISNRTLAYVAAKPAGLLLFGYVVWVLSYFRLLNYQNKGLIFGAFIVAVITGAYLSWRNTQIPIEQEVQKKKKGKEIPAYPWYKTILWLEAVTVALLIVYLFLRSYNAAINGTERFMDLALMSAAGKTDYFPFIDPWYAGKTVNYYYYGSYLMSLVSNLSNIPYALAYNITLGLVYVQSVVLSSVLVFTKTRSKMFALLAAFLVTTAGTLFYSGCVIREEVVTGAQTCTYASSTRLYTPSYIINEIPSYSFTVGDLHAHVLALPFFLFILILLYALHKQEKPPVMLMAMIGVSIASISMINAWDAITAACLLGVLLLIKIIKAGNFGIVANADRQTIKRWIIGGAITAVVGAMLIVPNLIGFQSPVLGLYFIPSYVARYALKNVQWPTPFLALLGMWGTFLITIAVILYSKRKSLLDEYTYPLILAFVSLGIIVGVEFFFVQDIYGVTNPSYFRANTTFKFGYHAWTMLSIAFSMLAASVFYRQSHEKITFAHKWVWLPITIAIMAGLFYPYKAIKQFYLVENVAHGLDGSLWMKKEMPEDLATVKYLNDTVTDHRAVIAEAVGDSYSTFSRIATYTGMITPMGWKTHEWTWRFETEAAKKAKPGESVETGYGKVSAVAIDIQKLYETATPEESREIIDRYSIEYIYIGDMERTQYPQLQEKKIRDLGTTAFATGNSSLIKVR